FWINELDSDTVAGEKQSVQRWWVSWFCFIQRNHRMFGRLLLVIRNANDGVQQLCLVFVEDLNNVEAGGQIQAFEHVCAGRQCDFPGSLDGCVGRNFKFFGNPRVGPSAESEAASHYNKQHEGLFHDEPPQTDLHTSRRVDTRRTPAIVVE